MPPSLSQRQDMGAATALYETELPRAREFLESRGIPLATAARYRLGVVGEPFCPAHDAYVGKLAIPYITPAGVVQIRFRSLVEGSKPKYMSMPGVRGTLYNSGALLIPSDVIVITEGELDALVVQEFTGCVAVGLPGASTWQPHYRRCFGSYRKVVVAGDGDDAGRAMAEAVASAIGSKCVVAIMPHGHDCNSLFVDEGPMALSEALGVL